MIKIDYFRGCSFNPNVNYLTELLGMMHNDKVVYSKDKPDYFFFKPKNGFDKLNKKDYMPGTIKILEIGEGPSINPLSEINPDCADIILSPYKTKLNNIHFPIWIYDIDWFNKKSDNYYCYPTSYIEPLSSFENRHLIPKNKFAAYIAKSGSWSNRDIFTQYIMDNYNHVDCAGKSLNNIRMPGNGSKGRPGDKLSFLKNYKFNIAFENHYSHYYNTEKIIQPFASGAIPIYWGGAAVVDAFNKNAFIYIEEDFKYEDALSKIKRVNESDDLFTEMQMQDIFKTDEYFPEAIIEKIKKILTW